MHSHNLFQRGRKSSKHRNLFLPKNSQIKQQPGLEACVSSTSMFLLRVQCRSLSSAQKWTVISCCYLKRAGWRDGIRTEKENGAAQATNIEFLICFSFPLECWNINFMINVWKEDGQSKSCTSAGTMIAVKCHTCVLNHFDPLVNIDDGLIHSQFL